MLVVDIMNMMSSLVRIVRKTTYGLVAQWTRARGYEPRCRRFDSPSMVVKTLKNHDEINSFTYFYYSFRLHIPLHYLSVNFSDIL